MSDVQPRKLYDPNPKKPQRRFGTARWLAEKALVLYYVGVDPATPGWAKGVLAASIASLFSLDLLLDIVALPIGAEVSLGSVVVAAGAFLFSVRKRHFERAREKIARLFGDGAPPSPPPSSSPPFLKP